VLSVVGDIPVDSKASVVVNLNICTGTVFKRCS